MTNIRAGDVVVCVASNCGDHGGIQTRHLVVGRFYTVAHVIPKHPTWHCPCGIHLRELATENPSGICGARFRKIEAPRTELSERIRKCRPIRIGADA